ncbi:MAG: lipid-A-disaccharide synthase [Nitrospirales bacterium]
MPKILLVTGETSGDMHGAKLSKALRELDPSVELIGVGGQKMLEAGVCLLPNVDRVDAMGVPGIQQLFKGWKTLRMLSAYVRREQLDAIILIDSPGLNLRLAKAAAKTSQNIIYYIAPQVWAWGSRRLHLMRKVVKHVLAILPFEEGFFRKAGIACHFVGHPLLDDLASSYDKIQERAGLQLKAEELVIGLLPGSREREVQDVLPTLLEAVRQIQSRHPTLQAVLAQAASVPDALIKRILGKSDDVRVIKGKPNAVIAASDLLLIASGTATLQAALIGTPMVIVYRTSPLTYQIAKRLVTIPYIGLVNILADQEVVPELLQDRMTSDNIAHQALQILGNPERQHVMQKAFQTIRTSLGGAGASKRAAELILAEIAS